MNKLFCAFFKRGFERWFNLTVVNISEDDADDYTCVGVNAGKGSHTFFELKKIFFHPLIADAAWVFIQT